jgi:ribonuclease HI
VYTDGSAKGYKKKTKGYGGWAYLHVVDGEVVHRESGSEEKATSNRMELTAILKSLLALGHEAHQSKVIVYSDSAYSVNAFRDNWVKKWEENGYQTKQGRLKNKDLWVPLIYVVKQFRDIEFIHVKGHKGNKYNEEADTMAQSEAEQLRLRVQPDFLEEKRRYNRLRARKTWAVLRPRKPVISD